MFLGPSVCLLVHPPDYSKNYELILKKVSGVVGHGSGNNQLDYGGNLDPGVLRSRSESNQEILETTNHYHRELPSVQFFNEQDCMQGSPVCIGCRARASNTIVH